MIPRGSLQPRGSRLICLHKEGVEVKKRVFHALAIAACVAFLGGCAGAVAPVYGGLYTKVVFGTNLGGSNIRDLKVGRSCVQTYLGLIALGDASIEAAKRQGGITRVAHVNYEATSFAVFYARSCLIVHGE